MNYGWLVVLAVVVVVVVLWRDRMVRAVGLAAAFIVWCSMGEVITVHRRETGIPTPWHVLQHVPLFDSLLASRLGLVAVPMIGFVLAVGIDRALQLRRTVPHADAWWPVTMVVGLVVALVPIVPTPIPVLSRNPVPTFVSDGTWKRYVGSGRSLVFAPLAEPEHIDPMAWQGEALMGYRMPGGYFLGPEGPDRIGKWPVSDRHFAQMLAKVGYRNEVVSVTDLDRAQAQNDLRAWHRTRWCSPTARPTTTSCSP